MSGTSLDGIDVAYLETDGRAQVVAGPALTVPYDEALRAWLRSVLGGQGAVAEVGGAGRMGGDALEAQAFTYLAVRRLDGLPLSVPGTTGVKSPTLGGRVFRGLTDR